MKKRNLFLTLGLSLTLGVGVAAGLGASRVEANEVKAENDNTTTFVLDCSSHNLFRDGATGKFKIWNGEDHVLPLESAGGNYYTITVDWDNYPMSSTHGFKFVRIGPDGTSDWGQGEWYGWWSGWTKDTVNYYKPSSDTAGTWSTVNTDWRIKTNADEWAESNAYKLTRRVNEEGLQYYSKTINFEQGDEFKVHDYALGSSDGLYGFNCAETGTGSAITKGFITGEGSGNLIVQKTGTYEIYMKPKLNKFWIQLSSDSEAHNFAVDFKAATKSICETGHTYDDHSSALSGIWEAQQTAWSTLTQGAKNLFKNGASSEDAEINDAFLRYRHIVTRYTGLLDFAEVVRTSSAINTNSNQQGLSSSTIIIVVGISITLLAVASFFVIRKRKEQE